jgi:hypothetical protein
MNELTEKLKYAKDAVIYLVAHADASVDFHGLVYWAGVVERLRTEIKELL